MKEVTGKEREGLMIFTFLCGTCILSEQVVEQQNLIDEGGTFNEEFDKLLLCM